MTNAHEACSFYLFARFMDLAFIKVLRSLGKVIKDDRNYITIRKF